MFLGSSDVIRVVLIPIKLVDSENYRIRRRSMKITLLGKRKYGFLIGTYSKDAYIEELHK